MVKLVAARDDFGGNLGSVTPSDSRHALVLAATTAESITVPTGARIVAFNATNAEYWVDYDTTAVIPAVDVTDGSAAELSPKSRYVIGVTSISIIAPAATTVTLEFWS